MSGDVSRIGKLPVKLPNSATFTVEGNTATVTGQKGRLMFKLPAGISAALEADLIKVELKGKRDQDRANYGTVRAIIANMVHGVTEGWSKKLELVGTGFRAEGSGNNLTLTVGFSHPVKLTAPEGVTFKVEKNFITVEGADREAVGQMAALVRAVRPPEPYKSKGIKYVDEVVRRKAGKAAKTAGAA